ncbi:helix-hairpin-helix domain-containing protein [Candidatus Margulisiibacteriota bacterium]
MLGDLSREQQLIILGLVLVIVAGLGVMAYRRLVVDGPVEVKIEEPTGEEENSRAGAILVHVAGAVRQEGVYKLKHGDRIIDVLELAGGAAALADLSSLNLAEKVKDGQKVIVPVKAVSSVRVSGDPVPGVSGTSASSAKININSATEKDLCKISGIGPSTARRIIECRQANGPFSRIDDIMKVKGIGKGTFGKIKGQITT